MFRARTERVIKTIICEIVEQCEKRGHSVSETLVGFMVKAVVLNPTNGFDVDHTLSEEDVQRLKQLCLEKLTEETSPGLDTIKMQLYFEMNYASRHEFLAEIHRILEFKLSGVCREITDNRAKSRDDFHTLYHQIITYILLRSAIGSPANFNCVQDTNAALQSVLPLNDLGAFLVLLKKDKEQQLKELTMIVTGIRIFNEAGKQNEEVVSLYKLMPAVLQEALQVGDRSIKNELSITERLVWRYTAVLEKLTHPNIQPVQCEMPITQLKQALYNVRQHESFQKILQSDASICCQRMESRQAKLSSLLKQLRETVQPNTAVPGSTVFPLFKAVTKLWFELQDEAELLHILSNITVGLKPFLVSQAKRFSEAYLDSLLVATEVKTDANRLAASSDEQIDPTLLNTQAWLLPHGSDRLKELPLEYNGFCGYMFVNRDGLLLPGNPSIGVLEHKERFYAFSSREAALAFASSPDNFVAQVAEKSKFFPELFQLLKLHQQLPSTRSSYSEREAGQSLWPMHINKREIGIQTVTHPVETHIDKSYEWNEWELRRKAIKLANIRTTVTHSMQTNLSHMRRDNVSQTWLPKEATSQTMSESGSNVPKPQTYLHGLRGQRHAEVLKVDLTRPVEENP
ncbi:cilia- and flagella-associated protein 206 isoform X2 [Poeciliopsis prolifica]|uniref:cilia- and flagella-associated protein 206 isoform X2 n=1 Tax=Poeciliopsis prolifica TaxID=188132 RepID=UPI0024137FBA|nr:cilia- and flagella-associated protein 206 isoform X2 [Poeciliopsis prolifica]